MRKIALLFGAIIFVLSACFLLSVFVDMDLSPIEYVNNGTISIYCPVNGTNLGQLEKKHRYISTMLFFLPFILSVSFAC